MIAAPFARAPFGSGVVATYSTPSVFAAGVITPAGASSRNLSLLPYRAPAFALSPKLQYDRDGSVGFFRSGAAVLRALIAGEMTSLNGESGFDTVVDTTASGTGVTIGVIFSTLYDVTGFWTNSVPGSAYGLLETSVDTTTGIDGTWVTQAATYSSSGIFRFGIALLALTGIKAIRITSTNGATGRTYYRNFNVYGIPTAPNALDRLRIWHPTLDQELATLDFGSPAAGSTYQVTFRVKNNSNVLYANSVVLSAEALTEPSPTVVSVLTLSQGAGFASTQTITQIAPTAISPVCTLRLTASEAAVPGLWRQRLKAVAGTWTTS